MRILAFSDLHRDRRRATNLAEMASDADVVVGAGDFASFRLGLDRTIDALRPIDVPTVLVPGNNESDNALWRASGGWPNAVVLHGSGRVIGGVPFFGLGGGVPPTPFPWSFDLSEEEAEARLADCPQDAVLVVHSPPRGHVDEAFGRHLGSEAILGVIEAKRPRLVICGHIHQAWGQEARVGETRVLNVGPNGLFLDV
jgi:Icc-related predicted phosphoesterase